MALKGMSMKDKLFFSEKNDIEVVYFGTRDEIPLLSNHKDLSCPLISPSKLKSGDR